MASSRPQGLVLQRDGDRGEAGGRVVVDFTLDDVRYLGSDTGRAALSRVEAHELTGGSLVTDIAALRTRFADRTTVLVETARLRRRAVAKLPDASDWLFTDDALQQATAAAVCRHRAHRLAGRIVHDATCSIGTELAALRDQAALAIGSDIDPVRLAMAAHNLGPAVALCRADALRPVTAGAVLVVDPARRSGSRRRFDPRDYIPALDDLLAALSGRDHVVKCSPGIDFAVVGQLGFDGEIEVTSLGGSVREACLWSAGLADRGVRRRATVLDSGEQIDDTAPDDSDVRPAGRWIVDPDGAVVRAGLVRHYAVRHGLWQLDPDIAYLSGDHLPDGVRGFEVIEQMPLRERHLRQALSARDVGTLEILVRGVDVDPDALRSRLRLRGSATMTAVITRIGSGSSARATVFLCRPSR